MFITVLTTACELSLSSAGSMQPINFASYFSINTNTDCYTQIHNYRLNYSIRERWEMQYVRNKIYLEETMFITRNYVDNKKAHQVWQLLRIWCPTMWGCAGAQTCIIDKTTRPHIPTDQNINTHRQQNLTSHVTKQAGCTREGLWRQNRTVKCIKQFGAISIEGLLIHIYVLLLYCC